MNPLEITALVIAVVTNLLLLGFVYLRNPRSATHKLFALLTLAMSFWSITTFLSSNVDSEIATKWLVRSVMFFAAPMSVIFFLLMHTFPRSSMLLSRRAIWIWSILTLLTMATALSPFLFPIVEPVPGSAPKTTPGPGMLLFIPIGIGTILLGIFYLIRKTFRAKGIEKAQMQFLLLGVVIMFTLIISLNFVAVNVLNSTAFIPFGPLFTLPFTLLAAYAIVRYRLMDIRAAIARSISFSILFGSFVLLYAGLLIFAVPIITELSGINSSIISAIGALLAVVVARYLRDALSQITDRFLFQQQRNYRAALVKISEELSGTIQINDVTRTIIDATSNVVRSKKAIILLRNETGNKFVPIARHGAKDFQVTIPFSHVLPQYVRHVSGPLIKDDLALVKEQSTSDAQIKKITEVEKALSWLDAPILLPLFVNKELSGMIVLGDKLSGEPYLQDDLEFLGALAPQAAVALENARLYKESLEFGKKLELEVKRATHELEVANTQLRDLDKAKSEFLSVASHQLNTPLTPLRGYLSMLLEGEFGKLPKEQRPIIETLEKSAVRLVDLIKNYLDISRIESGRLELNLESVNLAEMADGLTKDLLPNAIEKELELEFTRPKKPPFPVVVDRERIRQVMLNFIDNAIKYTEAGRVDVTVKQEGSEVVFAVTDTGRGLTQNEIAKLFTKFTRVGGRQRFQAEGTGLGLYVAKQIVSEHHGQVEVTSPGTGKGSTFAMRLPAEGSPQSLKAGETATVDIKAAATGAAPENSEQVSERNR